MFFCKLNTRLRTLMLEYETWWILSRISRIFSYAPSYCLAKWWCKCTMHSQGTTLRIEEIEGLGCLVYLSQLCCPDSSSLSVVALHSVWRHSGSTGSIRPSKQFPLCIGFLSSPALCLHKWVSMWFCCPFAGLLLEHAKALVMNGQVFPYGCAQVVFPYTSTNRRLRDLRKRSHWPIFCCPTCLAGGCGPVCVGLTILSGVRAEWILGLLQTTCETWGLDYIELRFFNECRLLDDICADLTGCIWCLREQLNLSSGSVSGYRLSIGQMEGKPMTM